MIRLPILAALLGVLATGGVALWLHARRAARLAAVRVRRLTATVRHIRRTTVCAVGICGAEVLTASTAHDWRVLLAVFCLPSLFAGDSVARLVDLAEFARGEDF